jgi:hypothetical protein
MVVHFWLLLSVGLTDQGLVKERIKYAIIWTPAWYHALPPQRQIPYSSVFLPSTHHWFFLSVHSGLRDLDNYPIILLLVVVVRQISLMGVHGGLSSDVRVTRLGYQWYINLLAPVPWFEKSVLICSKSTLISGLLVQWMFILTEPSRFFFFLKWVQHIFPV